MIMMSWMNLFASAWELPKTNAGTQKPLDTALPAHHGLPWVKAKLALDAGKIQAQRRRITPFVATQTPSVARGNDANHRANEAHASAEHPSNKPVVLRVVRIVDAPMNTAANDHSAHCRLRISGLARDVCAELERMAA
jgi:hypothetical protein